MSIVETYVPFTRKPPPGKRNRPGGAQRLLTDGNGGAPAECVPPAVTACRASTLLGSGFWFRYDPRNEAL